MVLGGFQKLLEQGVGFFQIYGSGFGRGGEYLQLDQSALWRLFFDRQSDWPGLENAPDFRRRLGAFGNNYYRRFLVSVLAGFAAGNIGDDFLEFSRSV